MDAYHNSHDLKYRAPFGAVSTGSEVTLFIGADEAASCALVYWRDGFPAERLSMTRVDGGFLITIKTPEVGILLWYHFELTDLGGCIQYYGNNDRQAGGTGRLSSENPAPYQITVYKKSDVPAWFTGGVVYQIFPDRFRRGRDWKERRENDRRPGWRGPARVFQEDWSDIPFYTKNPRGEVTRWPFFGGTLEGVREKLLYLKSLGVAAIYLNPIFLASSNHKYDTADYTKIDPGFGDEESFRRLCEEAKSFGIALILDGVFAHTGADSVYFNKYENYKGPGACQGPASPYYHWYNFKSFPGDYDSWWGVLDLPKTDKNNQSYQDFIYGNDDSIVRRWLRAGARGWRLDVADELPDGFIRGVRRAMTETDRDSVLIGEVWEDASSKVSYGTRRTYLLGGGIQSVTNYPFRLWLIDFMKGGMDAPNLAGHLMTLQENYPQEAAAMALGLIGSHDRPRVLTLLGDAPENLSDREKEYYRLSPDKYALAAKRLKLLSLIQFAAPGVPCVYYGDEAGLEGFEDPYNRAPYPWGHEDADLREHYRMLGLMRRQFRALRAGSTVFGAFGEHVFTISRKLSGEEILLIVNRGIFEQVTVTLPVSAGYTLDLLSAEGLRPDNGSLTMQLPPLSARLLCMLETPPIEDNRPRAAGILCAVRSVPSSKAVPSDPRDVLPALQDIYRFIDFLRNSGQKLWQILPLNPSGKGGSPFYSPSLFALGESVPVTGEPLDNEAYNEFCRENAGWLEDDALYWALKAKNSGAPWQSWPEDERKRRDLSGLQEKHRDAIEAGKRVQFQRHSAWLAVKSYAACRGVTIIGDLPIYAAPDSTDVWAHQDLFRLDEAGNPAQHAGVPPDYFSPDGQNWGNPLYDWDGARDGLFDFWETRLRCAHTLYDYVRIDHFRAFSAYFAIPAGKKTAEGHWLAGPGIGFIREMYQRLQGLSVIAEDLGVQDAPVKSLLKLSGFPGMLVWQFCSDEVQDMTDEELSHRVMYSGTHDNQTLFSWCSLKFHGEDPETKAEAILEKLYGLPARWVITPLQDVLGLGDDARMNTPGTVIGNWVWQAKTDQLTDAVASELLQLTERHDR